jgi:acetyl-CoA acetyltransferase
MAAAIVGAAESDKIGYIEEGTTATNLHIEAISNVCEMVGISPAQIEGVFSAGFPSQLAEYLGIHPKYIDSTAVGGCSFQMHVHHALAAINAGIIDIALVSHGEAGYSARKNRGRGTNRTSGVDAWSNPALWETPYGTWGAPTAYSHAMTRHMHRFGSTKEDFAQIAVTTRDWATLNPRAVMHSKETHPEGGPIDIETVLNSRMIVWPLNLLDICLVTDHGGAVIIASAEKAHSFKTKPVWIAGAGESQSHSMMMEMDDFTAIVPDRLRHGRHGSVRDGTGDDLRLVHAHRGDHRGDARPHAARRGTQPVGGRQGRPRRLRHPGQHQRRRPLVQPLRHVRDDAAG